MICSSVTLLTLFILKYRHRSNIIFTCVYTAKAKGVKLPQKTVGFMPRKKTTAFRLSPEIWGILEAGAKRHKVDKTALVEACIAYYAGQIDGLNAQAVQALLHVLQVANLPKPGPLPANFFEKGLVENQKSASAFYDLVSGALNGQNQSSQATPPPPASVSQHPKRRRGQ